MPCDHAGAEYVGNNQDVTFFRCLACGAIVVRQGRRIWIIQPRRGVY